MNYIDILLVVIILTSLWSGVRKGFILGLAEFLCWFGGLMLTLWIVPHTLRIFEKYQTSVLSLVLSFLIALIVIRLFLQWVVERFLRDIPLSVHASRINKSTGLFVGLLAGIIYATVIVALLTALPFTPNLAKETRNSRIAINLSDVFAQAQMHLEPVWAPINAALHKVTIAPGANKFVKLGFSVSDAKVRTELEAEMLLMVNREREIAGLHSLKADPEMSIVARKHSNDMFTRGYFSHVSPEGKTPFDRIRAEKVRFITAGENLALAQTLAIAHRGLMKSPGHRANILHKAFGRVGIGILDGGIYGIMVTQNFRN